MIWQIVVAFVGRACRTRSLESASARRAVTTPWRFPALPTRPAVAEALPGLAVVVWYGIAAPAKLPTSIFARLHAVIFRILDQPDKPERIVRGRLGTWGNSSEQFRHYIIADPVKWASLVGERCEAGLRRESGSKRKAARAAFLALAHTEIRCQSGLLVFFPLAALIDVVYVPTPPREIGRDPQSHSSVHANVKLVDDHGCRELLNAVKVAAKSEAETNYVLSTAHKAKGREWDRVRLGTDFRVDGEEEGELGAPDELRLFYVACTRAKIALGVPREYVMAIEAANNAHQEAARA